MCVCACARSRGRGGERKVTMNTNSTEQNVSFPVNDLVAMKPPADDYRQYLYVNMSCSSMTQKMSLENFDHLTHYLFTIPAGCVLSEANQGATCEGQTYLRQHVPEICREGFKGVFSTVSTRGRDMIVNAPDCTH